MVRNNINNILADLEEYMASYFNSEDEIKSKKRMSRKNNDWLSVMGISMPFNIILKYPTLYLNSYAELSENLTTNTVTSENVPDIKIVIIFLI